MDDANESKGPVQMGEVVRWFSWPFMKGGFKYALGIVIVALAVVILFQLRNMSRLRNHMSRLEGDTRALHGVLNSNAVSSLGAQEQIRKLQRENEEIRDELHRMSNRLITPRPSGSSRNP